MVKKKLVKQSDKEQEVKQSPIKNKESPKKINPIEQKKIHKSTSPIANKRFSLLEMSQNFRTENTKQSKQNNINFDENNKGLKFLPISNTGIERKASIISVDGENEYKNCIIKDNIELNKIDEKKSLMNECKL